MIIKLGSIITDAKGKLGGHVVAHGVASHVMYTLPSRTNNPSLSQQETRSINLTLQRYWSALSSQERKAWRAWAEPKESGINAFFRANYWNYRAKKDYLFLPPSPSEATFIKELTVQWSPRFPLFNIEGELRGIRSLVVVYTSRCLSKGVQATPKDMRVIFTASFSQDVFDFNLADPFRAVWGEPVAFTNLFIRIEVYGNDWQLSDTVLYKAQAPL